MRFVLTANSPGEVATWLTPAVGALRRAAPEAHITVFIVPCAFAAGTETGVVRALTDVDEVYGPRQYWPIALGAPLPPSLAARTRSPGALLYLGGDLLHAARLARRLQLPAFAYVERGSRWTRAFVELFVADEEARQRVMAHGEQPQRVRVVGNLMVDAVRPRLEATEARKRFSLHPTRPVVAVFPGSRPYEIRLALPFLLRALEHVQGQVPGLQVLVSLSSFADASVLEGERVPGLEGAVLHVAPSPEGAGWKVATAGGLHACAVQGMAYDVMQTADVAVTLPGSNTAEMAAAGLPMVVVLPLNLAEKIPLPGAAHYVERLPFIGKRLKGRLVRERAAAMSHVAWPNRKANARVVPEVRGDLHPEDVADVVVSLLKDPERRQMTAHRLRRVMGPSGAAERIAARLWQAATGDDTVPPPTRPMPGGDAR